MERFLNIHDVVENAMISLDSVDSRDRVIFRQWAYLAMRQIGFSLLNIQEKCVDVCDFSFEKPCDLVSAIEVTILDSAANTYRYKYMPNRGLLPADSAEYSSINNLILMSEDADFYYLSSNATNVSSAQIKYYGLPIDDDGLPMIPEMHLFSVMTFIEFMYIKRKRASAPHSVSGSDLSEFKDMWIRELMKAKGKNKMPSIHQGKAIFKRYMTMINKAIYKD